MHISVLYRAAASRAAVSTRQFLLVPPDKQLTCLKWGAVLKREEAGGVAATTHVAKSIFTFSLDQFLNGNEKFCAP